MNPFVQGDIVYVKPGKSKCTTVWNRGSITALLSNTAAEVDGMPRHISDLRLCHRMVPDNTDRATEVTVDLTQNLPRNDNIENDVGGEIIADDNVQTRESQRERRPPQWLAEFYVFD